MLSIVSLSRHIRLLLVAACAIAIAMAMAPGGSSAEVLVDESTATSGFAWTPTGLPPIGGAEMRAPEWDVALSADGSRVFAMGRGLIGDDYVAVGVAGTIKADGSIAWLGQQILQQQFQSIADPAIATSADGTQAVAVWLAQSGRSYTPHVAVIDWSGTSPRWTASTLSQVDDIVCVCDVEERDYPILAMSEDGARVSLAYAYTEGAQVMTATRGEGGLTWTAPERIRTAVGSWDFRSTNAAVVFSADAETVYARGGTWSRTMHVVSGTFNGTKWSWSPSHALVPEASDVWPQEIATSADGTRAVVTWSALTAEGGFAQLAATTDGGQTWSEPINIAGRSRFHQASSAAIDGSGRTGVLGLERRNSADGVAAAQAIPFTIDDGRVTLGDTIQLSPWLPFEGVYIGLGRPSVAISADGRRSALTWLEPSRSLRTATLHLPSAEVSGRISTQLSGSVVHYSPQVSADGATAIRFSLNGGDSYAWQLATGLWATTPDAPLSISVVPEIASIRASWEAPTSDGGATITEYTATAQPGGASCSTSTLTCTLEGLTPGTPYTVSVVARNALGDGQASIPSAPVVPLAPPPPPPGVVKDLVVTAGKRSVAARWTPPSGVPVSRFEVRLRGEKSWKSTAMRTSVTFQGLRPGRAIVVQVRVCGPQECGLPVSSKPVKPKR